MMDSIVLNVIIGNEERMIYGCMNSAYECGIRMMVICPNNTTDGSVAEINRFKNEHSDCVVYVNYLEWEGFGKTRTVAFNIAKDYGKYVLVLDADMYLHGSFNDYDLSTTNGGVFLRRVSQNGSSFKNLHILPSNMDWKCKRRVHEYWECESDNSRSYTDKLWIELKENNYNLKGKYEKYLSLLRLDLKDYPNDSRTLYYISDCYYILGKYDKCIKYCKLRVDKHPNKFREEVWSTLIRIAHCYMRISENVKDELDKLTTLHNMKNRTKIDNKVYKLLLEKSEDYEHEKNSKLEIIQNEQNNAVNFYLEAYNYRQIRVEPLIYLSRYYRSKDKFVISYMWAKFAYDNFKTPPEGEFLTVENSFYQYEALRLLSIVCYYIDDRLYEGNTYNNLLLDMKDSIPESVYSQAVLNKSIYDNKINPTK